MTNHRFHLQSDLLLSNLFAVALTMLLVLSPSTLSAQEENGFTRINVVEDFTDNGFQWFRDAQLLCAGNKEMSNAMTIGWGGIGTLWGRTALTVYVAEKRYTMRTGTVCEKLL